MADTSSAPPVLSLAFFGMLPRFLPEDSKGSTCSATLRGLETLEAIVLPSIRDGVLAPSAQATHSHPGFGEVHVYGNVPVSHELFAAPSTTAGQQHENSCTVAEIETRLRRVLHDTLSTRHTSEHESRLRTHARVSVRVQGLSVTDVSLAATHKDVVALGHPRFKIYRPLHRFNAIVSMETVLALLPPDSDGAAILLRWDTVFFARANFAQLGWHMLYRANWCTANYNNPAFNVTSPGLGVDVASAPSGHDAQHCNAMRPFYIHGCPFGPVPSAEQGVPDYWFAGNVSSLRMTFVGALVDATQQRFLPGNCTMLHGFLEGRLRFVSETRGLKLGRFLYQNFDFSLARSPLWDPRRRVFLVNASDVTSPPTAWEGDTDEVAVRKALSVRPHGYEERQGGGAAAYALWPHRDGPLGGAMTYAVDLPVGPSVCAAAPRFCGCPSPRDPGWNRSPGSTMGAYCRRE